MPEGPEVRLNYDLLRETLAGETLVEVKLCSGKLARRGIGQLSLPQQVTRVDVKGKRLLIELESNVLVSTLGMAGWWYKDWSSFKKTTQVHQAGEHDYKLVETVELINKHRAHVRLTLTTAAGATLSYVDARNFGNFTVAPLSAVASFRDELGPDLLELSGVDPLLWAASVERVITHINKFSRSSKMKLGKLLLDQELVAGVGNIYRAEALYLAQLSPFKVWSELSSAEQASLIKACMIILNIAYHRKGFMNYSWSFLTEHGIRATADCRGHLVYGKLVAPCGSPVKRANLYGRTVWYCPHLT